MNHYRGGQGHVRHLPEPDAPPAHSPLPPPEPAHAPPQPYAQSIKVPSGLLRGLSGSLDGILSRLDPGRLETEDLLILAVLWLLYRESGDRELLFALGAYLFL